MTASNGAAGQAPLYVRVLRLRHLHVGGFASFLLFECMIAVGVLLALAELVSWWAVPVLPGVRRELLSAQLSGRPAHVERVLEHVVTGPAFFDPLPKTITH